jgi:hypothetical protein
MLRRETPYRVPSIAMASLPLSVCAAVIPAWPVGECDAGVVSPCAQSSCFSCPIGEWVVEGGLRASAGAPGPVINPVTRLLTDDAGDLFAPSARQISRRCSPWVFARSAYGFPREGSAIPG